MTDDSAFWAWADTEGHDHQHSYELEDLHTAFDEGARSAAAQPASGALREWFVLQQRKPDADWEDVMSLGAWHDPAVRREALAVFRDSEEREPGDEHRMVRRTEDDADDEQPAPVAAPEVAALPPDPSADELRLAAEADEARAALARVLSWFPATGTRNEATATRAQLAHAYQDGGLTVPDELRRFL